MTDMGHMQQYIVDYLNSALRSTSVLFKSIPLARNVHEIWMNVIVTAYPRVRVHATHMTPKNYVCSLQITDFDIDLHCQCINMH